MHMELPTHAKHGIREQHSQVCRRPSGGIPSRATVHCTQVAKIPYSTCPNLIPRQLASARSPRPATLAPATRPQNRGRHLSATGLDGSSITAFHSSFSKCISSIYEKTCCEHLSITAWENLCPGLADFCGTLNRHFVMLLGILLWNLMCSQPKPAILDGLRKLGIEAVNTWLSLNKSGSHEIKSCLAFREVFRDPPLYVLPAKQRTLLPWSAYKHGASSRQSPWMPIGSIGWTCKETHMQAARQRTTAHHRCMAALQ